MEEEDILYMGHVLVWHFAFVYYCFMNHKYDVQRLSKYICHILCKLNLFNLLCLTIESKLNRTLSSKNSFTHFKAFA